MGSRVPVALRIFQTAAAIADDIGAKTVMAIFYSGALDFGYAAGAVAAIAALALLNRPAPTASRPMCCGAPCCGAGRALGERISSLSLSLILDLPGAHRPRVPTAFAVSLARRGSWRQFAGKMRCVSPKTDCGARSIASGAASISSAAIPLTI
jgi:hypothetical protein